MLKVAFIGPVGVGKSTLIHRIKYGNYKEQVPTVGMSFFELLVGRHRVSIWDCSGHQRFGFLIDKYIKDAHIVFVCSDQQNSRFALSLLDDNKIDLASSVFLLGTKLDHAQDTVTEFEDIIARREYENKHNYTYISTSSLTSRGVTEIEQIIRYVADKELNEEWDDNENLIEDGPTCLQCLRCTIS